MGGAGMAAVCTGILAPSGRAGIGKGDAVSPFLVCRAKPARQTIIRAADTPDKTKVGRKPVTACGQPW